MNFEYALTKYEDFLQKEYNDLDRLEHNSSFDKLFKRLEVVNGSLQRALGVSFYIQSLCEDYDYFALEKLYNSFKENVKKFLTD